SCHPKDRTPAGLARWGTARVALRPSSARCGDCHDQEHGTQLIARADRGECSSCHLVAGWTPSLVDSAAHRKLGWPLDGRHAAVACRACHGTDRKGLGPLPEPSELGSARFAFPGPGLESGCASCHLDPHGDRYRRAGEAAAPECVTCHDTRAFAPSTVDVVTHQRFRFPLEGAHRATPCTACHRELGRPRPARPASTLVAGGGRFPELAFQAPSVCESCHTVRPAEEP
ncbi:MAG TPA: hypothetical protein VFN96_02160, partial [Gemmatimonadales bacterium]|nr:hypothetical protein [Gemmatimonadales bacterium]